MINLLRFYQKNGIPIREEPWEEFSYCSPSFGREIGWERIVIYQLPCGGIAEILERAGCPVEDLLLFCSCYECEKLEECFGKF